MNRTFNGDLPAIFVTRDQNGKRVFEHKYQDAFWIRMTYDFEEEHQTTKFEHLDGNHVPQGELLESCFGENIDQNGARAVRLVFATINNYMNDIVVNLLELNTLFDTRSITVEDDEMACAGV
jgi:hypothetical protein